MQYIGITSTRAVHVWFYFFCSLVCWYCANYIYKDKPSTRVTNFFE